MFPKLIKSTSIPFLIVSLLSWPSSGMNDNPGLTEENDVSAERTYRQSLQQAVIFGTLLGADGQPMRKANVLVERLNNSKPLASAQVSPQGRFKLTTEETGLLGIRFTGTDHQSHKMILIVDKPLRVNLNVKLKSYDYRENISEVRIIGDFNEFSLKSARVMERRSDGTYVADFRVPAERFAYQLLGVTKDGATINGSQSDDYAYDGGGDYRSIVLARNGSVSIVFDPNKLNRSAAAEQVRFKDKRSDTARFVAFYDAMMRRRDELHNALVAYRKTGRPLNEFRYDWSHDSTTLEREISSEKRPLIRQLLLFSYLDIGFGDYGAKLNARTAREALAKIPPISPLWSIDPSLVGVAIDAAGDSQQYISYVEEIIGKHSDPSVVRIIRATLSPDRQIAVGKMAPNFSFVAFDNDAGSYTKDNLKGKILLIDFWATWCVPCIEEMPNLHKEYDTFKAQGFEILSVSLDEKPELVKEFRKVKWKMPWLHTLLSSTPEVKKQFEIVGIPKGVLLDRDGRIVATDRELRGRKLHETLAQQLNSPH
jgi:thiol-disulfide isomerase/thioredoxin